MEIDPKQSLRAAFRHLDTFSVPGIGTFVRRNVPAKIDQQSKKILPPSQEFSLEIGEAYVARLEDFYHRHYNISLQKARDLVINIRFWLVRELKAFGNLVLKGVGELVLVAGKEVKFKPGNDPADMPNPFFGLAAIDLQMPKPAARPKARPVEEKPVVLAADASKKKATSKPKPKSKPEAKPKAEPLAKGKPQTKKEPQAKPPEKKAVKAAPVVAATDNKKGKGPQDPPKKEKVEAKKNPPKENLNTIVADVFGDQKTEPTPEPKKKKSAARWLIPVLLLLLLAVAGFVFREEVSQQFKSWGWIQPPAAGNVAGQDGDDAAEGDGIATLDTLDDDSTMAEIDPIDESAPVPPEDDGEEENPEEDTTPVKTVPANDGAQIGTYAQPKTYYLVTHSTRSTTEAKALARQTKGKILRPRGRGFYKVYIHSSKTKSEVIAQMVANKDKYSKSWIFWPEM